MPLRELLSELRGVLVIAREEGANLGVVSGIYFDPKTARISTLTLGRRKGKDRYVDAAEIESFGRDLVMLKSEAGVKTIGKDGEVSGRLLKSLQGTWVTTQGGDHLGTLVDVDVSGGEWSISELRLADGKRLPVDPSEIVIGTDQILVPREYADRVMEGEKKAVGFMGRLFGSESVEEAAGTIRQALKKAPGPHDEGPTS